MPKGKVTQRGTRRGLRLLACVLAAGIALTGVLAFASATGVLEGGGSTGVSDPASAGFVQGAGEGASPEGTSQDDSGMPGGLPIAFEEVLAALPQTILLDDAADVQPEQAEHRADSLIARIAEGTSAADLNELLARLDFVVTKDVSDQDLSCGIAELELVPGTDVARAAYTLEETGAVEGAQPNYVYHLLDEDLVADRQNVLQLQTTTVNDASVSRQWALSKVQAYEAWDVVKTNGAVTVAVVDNGCVVDHEDLKANIVASYNAIDGGADVSHVSSSCHGTHVAGIVAAVSNNGKGVSGVSYNAQILPIQVFEKSGSSETTDTSKLVPAYAYVMDNATKYNIKVVNMSLGGYMTTGDTAVQQAVKRAYNQGIVTVCAAGNQDSGDADTTPPYQCFPVDFCSEAVGVINLAQSSSASDGSGVARAANSNYNMKGQTTKDISAPGTSIYSTYGPGASKYSNSSGTSMAAPLVAGILALEFAADSSLTAAGAVKALHDGATDLGATGWDEETGYGMANAYGALQQIPVSLNGDPVVKLGNTTKLAPSRYSASNFTWTSSDESVASVAADGTVTGNAVGAATITATWGKVSVSERVVVYAAQLSCASPLQVGEYVTPGWSSSLSGWKLASSDTSVAIVVSSIFGGTRVTAVGAGTAMIVATNAEYGISEQVDVTVYDPAIRTAAGSSTASVLVGEEDKLALSGGPDGVEWKWASSKETVCTVEVAADDSSQATVTGVKSGAATITATAEVEGRPAFTVSIGVSVGTEELTDEDTDIVLSSSAYTYVAGSSPTPTVTVKFKDATLTRNRHYTVEYADNDKAGQATVLVTGVNGYVGTVKAHFVIEPASIETAQLTDLADSTYSGAPCKPEPVVGLSRTSLVNTWFGPQYYTWTETLKPDVDYKLSYINNVNAGTATVTATGIGNYTGTASATFAIQPASIAGATVSAVAKQPYTGKAVKPVPTVKVAGRTLVAGRDYTATYANNKKAGTATITFTGKGNYSAKTTKKASFKIVAPSVAYRSKLQGRSWKSHVRNGATTGIAKTTKLRLQAVGAKLAVKPVSGSISYRVRTQSKWLAWKSNGASASVGASKNRLEALQVKLAGQMAKTYDVYYRVYVQKLGWSGWAKNGKSAGTQGYGLQVQAMQVKVVPKGSAAPGSTAKAFRKR